MRLRPAAGGGLHGFERRSATGGYHMRPLPSAAVLEAARGAMLDLAGRHAGLLVEDKRFALALHYRAAPHLEDAVVKAMENVATRLAGELELQHGKMVVELRPAGATKAEAVAAFLAEAPFAGRLTVFIGDDLTDEPAFELINRLDGLSVVVGDRRPSAARACLADVNAVHDWLGQLQAEPATAAPAVRRGERSTRLRGSGAGRVARRALAESVLMARLINVSNRVPLAKPAAPGGLAVGVLAAMRARRTLVRVERGDQQPGARGAGDHDPRLTELTATIPLPQTLCERCNRLRQRHALAALSLLPRRLSLREDQEYAAYQQANALFASRLAAARAR